MRRQAILVLVVLCPVVFALCPVTALAENTRASADGGASISVDGVVNPPDSSIWLEVGETALIDIHADQYVMGCMIVQGPGALDISNPTFLWGRSKVLRPPPDEFRMIIDILCEIGLYCGVADFLWVEIYDLVEPFPMPDGLVIDGLILEGTGVGDVVLTLTDQDLIALDVQTIHIIPEPMTIALLGLGGLVFLRKRRAA